MDRDGTQAGYDLALTRAIADAVPVPVIASGGVGTLDHLVDGVRDGPRQRRAGRLDLPFRRPTRSRRRKRHMAARRHARAARRNGGAMTGISRWPTSAAHRRRARGGDRRTSPIRRSSWPAASARCAKKLGEEAVEAAIAAVAGRPRRPDRRGRRRALPPHGGAAGAAASVAGVMAELERRTARSASRRRRRGMEATAQRARWISGTRSRRRPTAPVALSRLHARGMGDAARRHAADA